MKTSTIAAILVGLIMAGVAAQRGDAGGGAEGGSGDKCQGARITIRSNASGKNGLHLAKGTPGDDVFGGSPHADLFYGRRGDDIACGGKGDDAVKGGKGADEIKGGSGADRIFGGAGDDSIRGGRGRQDECVGERFPSGCEFIP